jgi:hypothetical protein
VQRLDYRLLEPFRPHSGSSFVDKPLAPWVTIIDRARVHYAKRVPVAVPDEEIANVDGGDPLAISFPRTPNSPPGYMPTVSTSACNILPLLLQIICMRCHGCVH